MMVKFAAVAGSAVPSVTMAGEPTPVIHCGLLVPPRIHIMPSNSDGGELLRREIGVSESRTRGIDSAVHAVDKPVIVLPDQNLAGGAGPGAAEGEKLVQMDAAGFLPDFQQIHAGRGRDVEVLRNDPRLRETDGL